MLNMIEMTKTEGWARLANWQDDNGRGIHSVRLCLSCDTVEVHLIDTQPDAPQCSGRASGKACEFNAVVMLAFAAMAGDRMHKEIEAEVRAEVERRMLERASATERAATDSERDARGVAE